MRPLLACGLFILAGCSQQDFKPPSGYSLIASLRVTEDAFEGVVKRKTATEFYLDRGSKSSGPSLLVISFVDGRIVNTLGGGIERSHLKRILATVPERPFDFYQRVSIVDDRMRKEADSRGQQYHPLIILDGLELEVFVMTKQGPMKFTEWNPGQVVSHYSKHDTSIKSLDSYLDALATFYGRSSLGL